MKGFMRLIEDSNTKLYCRCKNSNKLSFILYFYNLKYQFDRFNESFSTLCKLLKDAFPDGNTLPNSFYETKKFVDATLSMTRFMLCILFWKEIFS